MLRYGCAAQQAFSAASECSTKSHCRLGAAAIRVCVRARACMRVCVHVRLLGVCVCVCVCMCVCVVCVFVSPGRVGRWGGGWLTLASFRH